ncbi:MAG: HAD family phosphatase [Prevotellaceae bacterium]|nr:HAD family phosphatase [Prevotellaceae bacterium]
MIKNLVFDFGGVIVDISRERAVEAFYRLGLKDADKRLDKYHQTGIFQELEEGKLSADEFRVELGKLCGHTLTGEEVRQGWLGFMLQVDMVRLEFLERLRPAYRLLLLSNTNPYIMSWARSEAFTPVGKPLDAYFDGLYLSYKTGCMKPSLAIFNYMLAHEGIRPEETLFVDDGRRNVEAAEALGLHTLLAVNGERWCDALALRIIPTNGDCVSA